MKEELQAAMRLKDAEIAELRIAHEKERASIEEQKKLMEIELQKRVDTAKIEMWTKAQQAAAEKFDMKLKDLEAQNQEKQQALEKMQQFELELRKEKRELEEKTKQAEIELVRKLDAERKVMELQMQEEQRRKEELVRKSLEEEVQRKLMEKDQQVLQMKRTIDDLQRKVEQGSMQLQGDAQEENLKAQLATTFLMDRIEDVPTGIRGADLVQYVHTPAGQEVGVMLWESKNAKVWNREWLKKLKDDQAHIRADMAILATTVLPEGIKGFGHLDGVWVVEYPYAIAIAGLVRNTLLEIARTKSSLEGRDEKVRMLYEYLSGNQFRSRVENIVSAFTSMKEDLEAEKRALTKHWARREKQIERVVANTSGMYGDLEGLMGMSLPKVAHLELDFPGDDVV